MSVAFPLHTASPNSPAVLIIAFLAKNEHEHNKAERIASENTVKTRLVIDLFIVICLFSDCYPYNTETTGYRQGENSVMTRQAAWPEKAVIIEF